MSGLPDKVVISPIVVGRDEPLAVLGRRLELARAGDGRAFLLSGEAGIGKSRLVAEGKAHAARLGFAVLQGSCWEQDTARPLAPLVDLLRGFMAEATAEAILRHLSPVVGELAVIVPELPALVGAPASLPPPDTDKYRLFHAVERFLFGLAAQTPLLVVIEDIHWGDDASLNFLLHLAERLAARRLLLLLTYRSRDDGDSLARFRLAVNRARLADELLLAPLSETEVDAMLRAIFELRRPISAEFLQGICRLTEGNPFFIEEVIKSLVAAGDIAWHDPNWDSRPLSQLRIPHSIQFAVQQRMSQLEPDARHLMRLAAVVGRRFSFGLLLALTGLDENLVLAQLRQLVGAANLDW